MKIKRETIRKNQKLTMLAGTVGLIILVVVVTGCSTSKHSLAMAKYQTFIEPDVEMPAYEK